MSSDGYLEYCSNFEPLQELVEKKGLSGFKFHYKTKESTSQGSVGILKCVSKYVSYLEEQRSKQAFTDNAKDYILASPGTFDKN